MDQEVRWTLEEECWPSGIRCVRQQSFFKTLFVPEEEDSFDFFGKFVWCSKGEKTWSSGSRGVGRHGRAGGEGGPRVRRHGRAGGKSTDGCMSLERSPPWVSCGGEKLCLTTLTKNGSLMLIIVILFRKFFDMIIPHCQRIIGVLPLVQS